MSRIVELHDHGPFRISKADMAGPVVAVCRCGLSARWPLCDGSHAKTNDESPDTLRVYTRDAAGNLTGQPTDALSKGQADPRPGA